jgi:hypothetical protein
MPASGSRPISTPASCSPGNLSVLADADAAGIVLDTRGPMDPASRADNLHARIAVCAAAALYAHAGDQTC